MVMSAISSLACLSGSVVCFDTRDNSSRKSEVTIPNKTFHLQGSETLALRFSVPFLEENESRE